MPIKMIVMVKRKPGLSTEAFRAGYENSHSRIAVELFGHLWIADRRNYLIAGHRFAAAVNGERQGGPDTIGYDAISEFILKDEAALPTANVVRATKHFGSIVRIAGRSHPRRLKKRCPNNTGRRS